MHTNGLVGMLVTAIGMVALLMMASSSTRQNVLKVLRREQATVKE